MPLKIQNKAMYHSFINKYLQNIKFFRKKIEMKKKLEKIIFWGGLGVPLVRIGGLGVYLHRPKGKIAIQAIKNIKKQL